MPILRRPARARRRNLGCTASAHVLHVLLVHVIVLLVFALPAQMASGASGDVRSAGMHWIPRNPTQPTEVVIIGTRHSAQLEYPDHAPARLRALLNRIDPAAVGVETTPAWFVEGLYYEIAYESYGVAVPWAREKGREVRPIDWQAGTIWNARESAKLGFPGQFELGLGNVISPVGNLTIRQRVLYELALQEPDDGSRQRARAELEAAELNPTQFEQLRVLLRNQ